MSKPKSILKLAFHACCFVMMRDLLNQDIGDGFEITPTPKNPITKILDEMPNSPQYLYDKPNRTLQ